MGPPGNYWWNLPAKTSPLSFLKDDKCENLLGFHWRKTPHAILVIAERLVIMAFCALLQKKALRIFAAILCIVINFGSLHV